MPTIIKDGTGSSNAARVDASNRLRVESRSSSLQHDTSHVEHQAYQVRGDATPIAGTVVVLAIRNEYEDRDVAITYVRVQSVGLSGGTAPPDVGSYFDISTDDRTRTTGGSLVTPVNMYIGSVNSAALVTCYDSNPTLNNASLVVDRWYDEGASKMQTFNKQAALIIGPKRSMEITYTSDNTSGAVQARVSFLLLELDN